MARRIGISCFDSLLRLVTECSVPGSGPVACYDTAQRIGIKLGLKPQRVYLHAGTREGARLLGLDTSREYVRMKELPAPLQELEADDVKSFLCRNKHKLISGSGPHGDSRRGGPCWR